MTTVISPVEVINTIKPKNGLPFAVVEDSDVLGGFRAVLSLAERDAIPNGLRKLGMAVFVVATLKTYHLISLSPAVWTEAGGGGGVDASSLPVETSSWTGLLDGLTTVQQALNFVDTMLSDVIGPYVDGGVSTHAALTSGVHGISAFGASLVDDVDAATARTTLGLTSLATTDPLDLLVSISTVAGSAVSAHAALTSGVHGISAFGASLVDDVDAATARTTLGLGTAATQASSAFEAAGAVATGVSTHAALTSGVHGISAFGASLVDDANAAAARTTLGLGTAATQASSAFEAAGAVATGVSAHAALTSGVHGISAFGASLVDDVDAATARTTLGLAAVASTASAADLSVGTLSTARLPAFTGDVTTTAGTSTTTIAAGAVSSSKLGGDITTAGRTFLTAADASAQRTALGLGTAATQASSAFEAAGAVSTHAALTSGVHGISAFGASLVDDVDAATARTTLGLGTAATQASSAFEAAGAVATGVSAHAALTSGVHGISAFGASLVDDANAAAARTTLGLGTAATQASSAFEAAGAVASGVASHAALTSGVHGISAFGASLVDDVDAATARTTLGLGTAAIQASSAFEAAGAVSTHAALTSGVHGISAFGASLVDDADAATARTTLGLGTAATQASSAFEAAGAVASGVASHAALTSGVHGISAFGASLVDDANAPAARSTLGLGTAALRNISAGTAAPSGGSDGDIYLQYV